jgi:fumarylacetoacetase
MVESSNMQSFIPYDASSHFPLENIPLGVFSTETQEKRKRVCTRIGDQVIDLSVLFNHGFLKGEKNVFKSDSLNEFIALGKDYWHQTRVQIQSLFAKGNNTLHESAFLEPYSYLVSDVKMEMPISIGDYTDFYSSKNHAYNVGVMFRGPDNAL